MSLILTTDQTGANTPVSVSFPLTFNFIIPSSYTIDKGSFTIKRGSSSASGMTATLRSGLDGSGSVLTSVFVPYTSIDTSYASVDFVLNYALASGSYSLILSTTDSDGGSTQYSIKSGSFQAVDSVTGAIIYTFNSNGTVVPPTPTPTPTPTITPTPTPTPEPTPTPIVDCYTVRQYLYGYDPSSGNSGLYVLDSDYPSVASIPIGAKATINSVLVTVTNISTSNSIYFQGNPGHTINFTPSAGNIAAGTYIQFCWNEPTPTPTITPTPTVTPTPEPTVTPTPIEGIILLYNFSNSDSYPGTGTTVFDLIGHSNGTLVNGPSFPEPNSLITIPGDDLVTQNLEYFGITSCGNYCLEFDGINDYVITNSNLNSFLIPPNTSSVISIFTWVYPMEDGVIVSEQGNNTPDSFWFDSQIEIISGTMKFAVWPYDQIITSSIPTPFDHWYYAGFTYDGTTLKAYVNAQLAGTAVCTRATPYNAENVGLYYALGYGTNTNMGGGPNFAKMKLGTFEIYNKALSGSEVLSNYNNSYPTWLCSEILLHKLRNHGHYNLTNRGVRYVRNTKRLYKNIFHRLPGSAYFDHD